jgi:hypothetical protein
MANENAFTASVEFENDYLPEDSPSAQQGKAFRELQLSSNPTPEQIEAAGLPSVESQAPDKSQVSVMVTPQVVATEDTQALPEGASGRIISSGLFEIIPTSSTEAAPVAEQPKKVTKFSGPPKEDFVPTEELKEPRY